MYRMRFWNDCRHNNINIIDWITIMFWLYLISFLHLDMQNTSITSYKYQMSNKTEPWDLKRQWLEYHQYISKEVGSPNYCFTNVCLLLFLELSSQSQGILDNKFSLKISRSLLFWREIWRFFQNHSMLK